MIERASERAHHPLVTYIVGARHNAHFLLVSALMEGAAKVEKIVFFVMPVSRANLVVKAGACAATAVAAYILHARGTSTLR